MTSEHSLARRLGTGDAVTVGLSAMIGAGVFAVWGPAATAAGRGLLVGLGIAAVIAVCNAVASAQLAQSYPSSGGTYLFGREVLGQWWGFVAGWGFVIGKTASCAAMAMTFAAYAVPGEVVWQRVAAVLTVAVLTFANLRGVTRTARLGQVLLAATLLTLVLAVAVVAPAPAASVPIPWSGGAWGVLESAGLIFFAFAGYARIATLAEEVRRPEMLGRAILLALGVAAVLYAVVGVLVLRSLGDGLAGATTPLADAVAAAGSTWAVPLVRIGAAAAALGALLALLAGISRTGLAMARNRDLPGVLAHVHPVHRVPDLAQLVIGVAVVGLTLLTDLRGAIGFSSCGVLVYYFVANASAYRQPASERRWPRALNLLGMAGCAVLVVTLPWTSTIAGLGVLAVGVLGRRILRHPR